MPMARRKVLVVEDDESLREAIERLLGAAGIEARMYPSAEALLANGAAATAACVVSDWKLPELNGLQLFDAIRARGWEPPLILITAHDSPGLREEAERHGATAYLAKPFRGTVLIDAIHAITGGAQPQGGLVPEPNP